MWSSCLFCSRVRPFPITAKRRGADSIFECQRAGNTYALTIQPRSKRFLSLSRSALSRFPKKNSRAYLHSSCRIPI